MKYCWLLWFYALAVGQSYGTCGRLLPQGQHFILRGPAGSGKTLVQKAILAMVPPATVRYLTPGAPGDEWKRYWLVTALQPLDPATPLGSLFQKFKKP